MDVLVLKDGKQLTITSEKCVVDVELVQFKVKHKNNVTMHNNRLRVYSKNDKTQIVIRIPVGFYSLDKINFVIEYVLSKKLKFNGFIRFEYNSAYSRVFVRMSDDYLIFWDTDTIHDILGFNQWSCSIDGSIADELRKNIISPFCLNVLACNTKDFNNYTQSMFCMCEDEKGYLIFTTGRAVFTVNLDDGIANYFMKLIDLDGYVYELNDSEFYFRVDGIRDL